MIRRRGILGGIALVGAGALVYLIVSSSEQESRELGGNPEHAMRDRIDDAARAPDPGAETKVEVGAAKIDTAFSKGEQGWTLRGRLLRYPDPEALEPKLPVVGALIRLSLNEDAEEPKPDFAPHEVRSGPDGRFEITGVPGKAKFRLLVDAEGCALRAVGFELPELEEPRAKELPDIVLEESERLVVLVKGPRRQPVENARVSARLVSAPEGSREGKLEVYREEIEAAPLPGGEYVFERLPRGVHDILARAPGYASKEEQLRTPRPRALELYLRRGNTISGTVRSTAGEPISGAHLGVGENAMVVTDEEGSFRLEDLDCFGSCYVEVSAKGFCDLLRAVDSGEVDLVLPRESVISGRVLSASTRLPLRGASVSIDDQEVKTDQEGAFRLEKIPPGTHEVGVGHPDHVPLIAGTWEVAEGELVTDLELELEPGITVRGRVVAAAAGNPVPGATVTVSSQTIRAVTCNSAGTFELRGLTGGEHPIRVAAEGYSELKAVARATGASADDWTFALEAEAALQGRVLDPDGNPLAGAHVCMGYRWTEEEPAAFERSWDKSAWTDSRGAYRFSGIPAYGGYCLLGTLQGKLAFIWTEGIPLEPSEKKTVDLRFSRGGVIRGRVRHQDGSSVSDASVMAFRADGDNSPIPADVRLPECEDGWVKTEWAEADPSGEFEFHQLPPSRYSIWASSEHCSSESIDVDLEEGMEHFLDITLKEGCVVSGRVVDERGEPVEGVTVNVSVLGSSMYVVSDDQGLFAAEGFDRGRGVIETLGFGLHGTPVPCDSPSSGNVITVRPAAVLIGRVEARGRKVPPHCSLILFRMQGIDRDEVFHGETDAASRFTAAVPPGKYFLEATAEGFACGRLEVELEPGARREMVIELIRSGSVRVELDGDGAEGSDMWEIFLESPASAPVWQAARVDSGTTFEAVSPGPAALVAVHWDRGLARVDGILVTAGETTVVRLSLSVVQGIFGQVTRRGDPLDAARVLARGPGGSHLSRTTSSGWYQIEDLEPGAYEVQVEDSARRSATVTRGNATQLDVDLAAALVSGTVTMGGKPAAKVAVAAAGLLRSWWDDTTTDATGEWSLQLPAPEEYVVDFGKGGATRSLVLEEGQGSARLDITLESLPLPEPEEPDAPDEEDRSEDEN